MLNEHYARLAYKDLEDYRAQELFKLLARAYQYIDTLTEEQMILLSLAATLALEAGYRAGIAQLTGKLLADQEWPYVLVIDLPAGQVSFPLPAGLLSYFRSIPVYSGSWYGYNSEHVQKRRLLAPGCAVNGYNETVKCQVTPPRL
jgi:hypothetical protein